MAGPPGTDDIERKVLADIAEHGWHVVKVMGDESAPAWAYTIGLFEGSAHPELAVFGLGLDEAHELLNHLGALVRMGRAFGEGLHTGVFEELPCSCRRIDPCWYDAFFGNAAWHYRSEEFPMLQCFWPDAEGRFPWDPGFAASWREMQPLLFESDVTAALSPKLAETLRNEGAL